MPKKWVLFSLLTLLVIIISFQLLLQSGLISEKARRYAEESIERFLGQKAHIDQIDLRFFSASATFKNISLLPKTAGAEPPIAAKEIRIYFNPWSLLTRAFIVRRIIIESPTLNLTPETFAEKPFSFKKSPGAKDDPPSMIIRLIQINNGTLFYHGGEGGSAVKEVALKGINTTITPDLLMRQFEIEIAASGGSFSTEKGEKRLDRLEATLLILPDQIQLKEMRMSSAQAGLRAAGNLPYGNQGLDLQIEARLQLQETGLAPIPLPAGEKVLSGEATAKGRLTGYYPDLAFAGNISLPHLFADGSEVGSVAFEISYQKERALLTALSGTLLSGSFSGEGEGTFANDAPSYRLALRYEGFPLEKVYEALLAPPTPPDEKPDHQVEKALQGIFLEGSLSLAGKGFAVEGFTAEGNAIMKRRSLFSGPAPERAGWPSKLIALFQEGTLKWSWAGGRLNMEQGLARLPETEAAFHGEWRQADGFAIETSIDSSDLRRIAGPLRLPIAGGFHLAGALTGDEEHPLFKGEIALQNWSLRDQPFGTLASQILYEDERLLFKEGTLRAIDEGERDDASPPYRFDGNLQFNTTPAPAFEFQVDAASADPQKIFSLFGLAIPLYTRATGPLLVKGTPLAFSVKGPLALEKGTLYGEPFDRGSLDLTVNQKETILKKVVLERGNDHVEGEGAIQYLGTFQVAVKASSFRIQESRYLHAIAPGLAAETAFEVEGHGSFKKPVLKMIAAIQSLSYGEEDAGPGIVRADLNDRSLRFEGDFPERELSMKGSVELIPTYPFTLQSHFKRVRVDPFFRDRLAGPLSKLVLLLTGEIEGTGTFAALEQSRFAASFSEVSADFEGYPVQNDGPIVIRSGEGIFRFESARFKGENTALEFNGALTLFKAWDLFVKGSADLNLIKFFTKEISGGKGTATLDLRVSDQWKNPRIRGELALRDGMIRTDALPQAVHISYLTIAFSERMLLLESLEGELGRGQFHASGKADIVGFGLGEFSFVLELSDARIHLFPELIANVDGEFLFKGNSQKQTLQGEMTLKRAVYDKKVELKSLVGDLRQKREEEVSVETPLIGAMELNIHLFGRENISINNNIAKAPLEVDLFIKGTFDHPVVIGRIDIPRGSVYFRKNEFILQSGSIDFLDSDKIDPNFDFKAKTQIKDQDTKYAIDLSLSGRLSQFTLTLASSPPLPETDILFLLTVGKTSQEIVQSSKGGGGAEVTSFVVSELLDEGVPKTGVVDRIQVDPYTNGAKSSSGTRLTAEKKLLEDRLLVTYSITLNPAEEQRIQMIYELGKNVSLVGERDEFGRIGGDIRFRFEFR